MKNNELYCAVGDRVKLRLPAEACENYHKLSRIQALLHFRNHLIRRVTKLVRRSPSQLELLQDLPKLTTSKAMGEVYEKVSQTRQGTGTPQTKICGHPPSLMSRSGGSPLTTCAPLVHSNASNSRVLRCCDPAYPCPSKSESYPCVEKISET